MPVILEVIACSLDDAVAAEDGGASRLELVSALPRGGLTPSLAVLDAVLQRVSLPVRVMVRETIGHVVDGEAQRQTLLAAARALAGRPIDGIVFGALDRGVVDEPLLAAVATAAGCPVTFHRAFESVADSGAAIGTLKRHPQVDRILYNGGDGSWEQRAARIAALAAVARPSLRFIIGGGVTEHAIAALANVPDVFDIHVGRLAREPATDLGRVTVRRVSTLVELLREAFG